ncbi:unnamed protein product [Hermetia illucens]|uniref:THAP-type domain-containing protein n=1 Tax=Hermetia illucens TaxID=343691 RepID=A0A7R8UGI3_HERIL|nr:uncharacterized protein LOC119657469 [Hermetia illucens]CAD7080154.1 unnamed protein product [Hermetia illucens]
MNCYCAYANCRNKYVPCSSITFFNIPKDYRREIWIANSGNPSLANLKTTTHKQFCEKHFDPKYLRRNFTRTLLRKDAVPYKYDERKDTSKSLYVRERQFTVDEKESDTALQSSVEDECIISSNLIEDDEIIYQESEDQTYVEDIQFKPENLQEYTHFSELLDENTDFITSIDENPVEQLEDRISETEEHINDIIQPSSSTQCQESTADRDSPTQTLPVQKTVSNEDYDEDRHFALSLLGYFKHLPPRTKAIAKLKILQYLTELELDNHSDALK